MHTRTELLDIVVIDGRARGIVVRDLVTGEIGSFAGDAVVLATGGYSNVYNLSTNAKGCNVTATWRAHKRGAGFANPCYNQIHPTCIPASGEHQAKLTLMSESLRNDGRIWVPKQQGDTRRPRDIPDEERYYYLGRALSSLRQSRAARRCFAQTPRMFATRGSASGATGHGVYLDFRDAIASRRCRDDRGPVRQPLRYVRENYGRKSPPHADANLPPRPTTRWAGLWVDYNLMTTMPGTIRHWRGKLFGSRRQPARCQLDDAVPWPTGISSYRLRLATI